jgi:hypothetical protein
VKLSNFFAATLVTAGFAFMTIPASAEPVLADGVCPAVGFATGCNVLIVFNADGSVSTSNGSSAFHYDIFDTLVGVVNDTANTILSINLSAGQNIFGFTGNGIDGYGGDGITPAGNNPDTTGYGGPDAYFSNIVSDPNTGSTSGTVNFANGGIAGGGGTDYFSLQLSAPVSVTSEVSNVVPEPATLGLLGVGMLAAGFARRYHRRD